MSRAFIGIKEIGGGEVNLAKVLRKIDRRVLHVEKSDAFFMLERNAKRKGVSKARQRKHGENLLALSMRKIFRRGSREAFHALPADSRRAQLIEEYRARFASPYMAASHGMITDVISPAQTRSVLSLALRNTLTKSETRPPKKHGLIPL